MPKSHKLCPREFKDRLIEMVREGRTPEELAERFRTDGAVDPETGSPRLIVTTADAPTD